MPAKGHGTYDVDCPQVRSNRSFSEVVPIRHDPFDKKDDTHDGITVVIADDHPVVREGLVALINRRPDMRVIAEAGDGREAVERYFALRPNVGFFDLRMPIMDGVDAVMAIRRREPAARLAIFSSFQNEEDVFRAVQVGVRGYLPKDSPTEELVKGIRAVANGEMWIPPVVAAKLASHVASRQLTAREVEVMRSLADGKSNKEIANLLNISEATVKVHVTHIFEKLKVTGRTQAIGVAVRLGLLGSDWVAAA
jgi:two-component system NarL family response regulator